MANQNTRREILRGVAATAGLAAFGFPEWAMPPLAQGETAVPFIDVTTAPTLTPTPDRRIIDITRISSALTPRDQFFTTQHFGHPDVDPVAFRLKVGGLVDRPLTLSLDDLRKMESRDLVFGFECSGNRRPYQGLSSNGRWTGVPLRAVLDRAGVKAEAREFVFFGADKGPEEVEFRGTVHKVEQYFGRSMPREKALSSEPMLAYAMNGEPLTKHQGFPLRLIVPGWYGVGNVKWLSEIHAQTDPFVGKWQARWYRTLRGETINGELKWVENAISHMRPKSFIARVTKVGNQHRVFGVILNDGTPIKAIEVKIDEGPWQPAQLDQATAREKFGWKFFTYTWNNATPGEHTLVSRLTQADGLVQPTEQELANKKTFLEDNSQHPRKVNIS
jgi:DMSO/TMAO reductase YedYZ molybdopterin-dependent catalytic subunit